MDDLRPRPPPYIAIEGVIGVGKTTLARLLQSEYGAALVLEAFEDNPFLPLFYQEPERYAFQTQIVFLLSRYHQQRALMTHIGHSALLSDYLFAKDRLFAELVLEGDEWETYQRLHEALAAQIARPDLVIYLRASVETLMARIAQRDRPYERTMARSYIARLAQSYEHFFSSHSGSPVVVVDTDDLNVLTNEEDLARIRGQLRAALDEGLSQQPLPLGELPTPSPPLVRPTEPLPGGDPLHAYLRFQAEAGALAAALGHPGGEALPEALGRTYARLDELSAAAGLGRALAGGSVNA